MQPVARIVLNCDCGEGFVSDDEAILPYVTAANIACGGHAGDECTMRVVLRLCKKYGVSPGAHPAYPDRARFGRVEMPLSAAELAATVRKQVGLLLTLAQQEGVRLTHVKPHGALYQHLIQDETAAAAFAQALAELDPRFAVIGQPDSALLHAAEAVGLRPLREAVADRVYERDSLSRNRALPSPIPLEDDSACLAQALDIVLRGQVRACDGTLLAIQADTISIHSDTPGAVRRARALSEGFRAAGIALLGL